MDWKFIQSSYISLVPKPLKSMDLDTTISNLPNEDRWIYISSLEAAWKLPHIFIYNFLLS